MFNMVENKKLIVLIPFKNREESLGVFIPYFHNFMKKIHPNISYEIVIVEQCNDKPFNKGLLFNAGFLLTKDNTDYYVLHDVDQLPLSANLNYQPEKVYHLCVNTFEQKGDGTLLNFYLDTGFQQRGGAVKVTKEHYELVNGHCNNYWGWGCIDDDFSLRCIFAGLGMHRYHNDVINDNGYYIALTDMTKRFKEDPNYLKNLDYVNRMLHEEIDWKSEGLNTTKFELLSKIIYPNYIRYKVDF